jgi:predicted nucleic acid-binding protein
LILYVDSSSILSVHLVEPKRHQIATVALDTADVIATSPITYAEVRSGLACARFRDNPPRIESQPYSQAVDDFDRDWPAYFRLSLAARLVRTAGVLAEKYRLRGYDAVHLASILALRQRVPDLVTVSTWDIELAEAAVAEGLSLAHEVNS